MVMGFGWCLPATASGTLIGAVVLLSALGYESSAQDDVDVFRVYDWSSFEAVHPETAANCRAIDKTKGEQAWAVGRREVADVSDLENPDKQKQGTVYRVFVDYCVRLDGNRERPVGAMAFKAAPLEDLSNVRNWGNRHYRTTTKVKKKKHTPGREHFDFPNFEYPR